MYNDRERAIGMRASANFPLLLCEGQRAAHCRATELSATGIVVERGRPLSDRELRASLRLELFIPGSARPVRALAKVARAITPTRYALRFVLIADVDRLSLMEHLDQQEQDSQRLLDEIAGAA
jgi:hypothetical protein